MSNIPTRVAFVCFSRSLGGLELAAIRLAKVMRRRGLSVWIIAPPGSLLIQRAVASDIFHVQLEPRWRYGDPFAARRLSQILKENNIEVAVMMQSKDIHLAAFASLSSHSTKFVFLQQMQSGFDKRGIVHTWVYSKLSLWITLTERMRNDVAQFTRFPIEKVVVNPIGSELSTFDPSQFSQDHARTAFGLPAKGPLIGVLGRLDPQKGQEVLLQATPSILEQYPDSVIVIVGDETAGERGYKDHLTAVSRDLGIDRSVRFLPFTDDVPQLLASLDVFVLPSFSETFGYVLVEAMAMEKPIVATNAGGVPEIISDGRTGILVEPRDHAGLSQAVIRILKESKFALSLGRTGRAEAIQRYDVSRCADELLRAFQAL